MQGHAVAGGEELLQVLPALTVRPELLGLAPGHFLAQAEQVLSHPDLLQVCQGVVAFTLEDYRYWTYKSQLIFLWKLIHK